MQLTTLATIVSFFSASPFVAALRAMRQSNQTMGVKPRALAVGRVKYHGGPVISNVAVVTIFWGGAKKFGNADQINDMYRGITGSGYMDWLTEYNTNTFEINTGATQTIGRGHLLSTFSYDAAPTNLASRSAFERLLKNLINTGHVPPPTADTYYAIHFAPGYYIPGLCAGFCAGTSTIKRTINPTHIRYGIVATPGSSSCSSCLVNSDVPFASLSYWASFDLLSAVTDPDIGFAGPLTPYEAWVDPNVGTISQICRNDALTTADFVGSVVGGDGVTYTVAKGYSNAESACITSSSTPPP